MAKRLIVCSDGTWNTPMQERGGEPRPTNVVKMWRAIAPEGGGMEQIKFYDEGVGAEGNLLQRILGGASGHGLNKNITDGYRFLMHTYEPGDSIFLFGFSRGAYTVRSLAGMLRNSGLLYKSNEGRLDAAFDLYRRSDAHPDSEVATSFRNAFSREVEIEFLGVWDTVGSLGIPPLAMGRFVAWVSNRLNRRHQFHDMELSGSVKRGYHALAIDELRAPFTPAIWEPRPPKEGMDKQSEEYQRWLATATAKPGQTVEQVWFCGYHSDVGGGTASHTLSDVALEWMMQKAAAEGLAFDGAYVHGADEDNHKYIDADPLGPDHDSRTGVFSSVGKFERSLGTNWPVTEFAHRAAKTRLETDSMGYEPRNLQRYLDENPDRIAEPDDTHMPPAPDSGAVPENLSRR